jgi:hypothetical protein
MKRTGLVVLVCVWLLLAAASAQAIVIGYYDGSRESWGFSGGGPYLSQAKQYLVDQGNTLVSTNMVDATFLSGVDAFYTGLISSVSSSEVAAMQNFVDNQGGFLFIQTDWTDAPWTAPANTILSNWGIAHAGSYYNDSGHYTVGSSEWVTNPNVVTNFIGSDHSVVTSAPSDFEVLGRDSEGRTILGVFDAGAGRSSDVLISTDINFWDDLYGWQNASNRELWANIWQTASNQIDPPVTPVPAAVVLGAMGLSLGGWLSRRWQ